MVGSEGNCLSSSISGFLTRETKTRDSGPMYEPEETMKIFRDGVGQHSRSDACEWGEWCQRGTNKLGQPCGTPVLSASQACGVSVEETNTPS